MNRWSHATGGLANGWSREAPGTILAAMNAGLARKGRMAVGGVSLVAVAWLTAPWLLCTETWAREPVISPPPAECQERASSSGSAPRTKPFSLRDHAPPLAPRLP